MTVSNIGVAYRPAQTNQASKRLAPAQTQAARVATAGASDTDGDHDGDTAATDAKGLDARG
ncbi:MAG TPA: hypothetical protein VFC78_05555 [Tepidisphaeraceae bacterium]|nr:hypothetical protein [Tepidisphaeraceae bacterium]